VVEPPAPSSEVIINPNTADPLVANRGAKTRQLLGMKGAAPGKLHLENPPTVDETPPDLGRSVRRGLSEITLGRWKMC